MTSCDPRLEPLQWPDLFVSVSPEVTLLKISRNLIGAIVMILLVRGIRENIREFNWTSF